MLVPDRILRAAAERIEPALRDMTPKQQQRHERILRVAEKFFVTWGVTSVPFNGLAAALKIGPGTLRQHFVDRDCILFEILRRHLTTLKQRLADLPKKDFRARHRAYTELTRDKDGNAAGAHLLLTRERHTLPTDLQEEIIRLYEAVGAELTATSPEQACELLDLHSIPAPMRELLLEQVDALSETVAMPQAPPLAA